MGEYVGFDLGFSVVTMRAGLARVGNTTPDKRVVVDETDDSVVDSVVESPVVLLGGDVNKCCLNPGGKRPLKSSKTVAPSRPSMPDFAVVVVVVVVVVGVVDSGSASGISKPGGRKLDTSSNLTETPPKSLLNGLNALAASVVDVVVLVSVVDVCGPSGSFGSAKSGGRRALMSSFTIALLLNRRSKSDSVVVSTTAVDSGVVVVDSLVEGVVDVVDRGWLRMSIGCRGRSNDGLNGALELTSGASVAGLIGLSADSTFKLFVKFVKCLLNRPDWSRSSSSIELSDVSAADFSSIDGTSASSFTDDDCLFDRALLLSALLASMALLWRSLWASASTLTTLLLVSTLGERVVLVVGTRGCT